MLIAQISDCHIGYFRDPEGGQNTRRLRAVIDRLSHGPNRPDLLLVTGDLTEFGDAPSYARLAGMLELCPFPVRIMAGNHDNRDALLSAFPDAPSHLGFLQFEVALPGLRLIALDTMEPGLHSGEFCAVRIEWLRERLDSDTTTPVVIAMHHPPVDSGLGWLDCDAREPWIARFGKAIAGRSQIRAILTGHLHRPIYSNFMGVPLIVCPPTAPTAALDLNPIDPELPDDRALMSDEPGSYALHRWDGERLTTHFEAVRPSDPWPVLARFHAGKQEAVRAIRAKRRL